jgi:hypothetical protein
MVAVAVDRADRAGDGIYRTGQFHGACAIYLFSFLSPCKKIINPRKRYWSSPLVF